MAHIQQETLIPSTLLLLCTDILVLKGVLLPLQLCNLAAQVLDCLLQLLNHSHVLLLQAHSVQHGLLLEREKNLKLQHYNYGFLLG